VDERGEIRQEGLELFFVLAPSMRRTLERTRDKRSSVIIFTRLNILVLVSFVISLLDHFHLVQSINLGK
jgi:hypothetical protein